MRLSAVPALFVGTRPRFSDMAFRCNLRVADVLMAPAPMSWGSSGYVSDRILRFNFVPASESDDISLLNVFLSLTEFATCMSPKTTPWRQTAKSTSFCLFDGL